MNAPPLDLPQSLGSQDTLAASPVASQEPGTEPSESRYQRQEEFARGGLGRIVKAYDKRLSRPVAIKELLQRRGHAEARFLREATITARLQHPAIVPVYDVGRGPDGEPFYAMKMVEGLSFDKVIAEKTTLAGRLALLPHLITVAEAIAYAHSQHIIHRDLKPHNILVGEFGETVVIDWGLAKDLTQKQSHPEEEQDAYREVAGASLTTTGSVMGTPAYMPPEQALGKNVEEPADVYSLGAILYQLLCGAPPYTGRTSENVINQVVLREPPPLEERQPGIPQELLAIVEKAMQRDVKQRYPNAGEVAADLKKFQTGQLVGAYQYSRQELLRRWLRKNWVFVFAAVAVLLTLGVVSLDLQRTNTALAETEEREQMANVAKEEADQQRKSAELREKQARSHADNVSFEEAKLLVRKNPVRALELLSGLSEDFPKMSAARIIAADALSQKRSKVFRGGGGALVAGTLTADEKELLALEEDGTLWRFPLDAASPPSKHRPKEMSAPSIRKSGPFFIADFSTDKRHLAFVDTAQSVWLVDTSTFESKKLGVLADWAIQIKFSHDGALLAVTTGGNNGFLWEVSTGRSLELQGHLSWLIGLSFSPDGSLLATASDDRTARLWELRDGAFSFDEKRAPTSIVLSGHSAQVQLAHFSPDRVRLATSTIDGAIKLWSIPKNAPPSLSQTLESTRGGAGMIGFSPSGAKLFSFGRPRSLLVWSLSGTLFERRWTVSWDDSDRVVWAGFSPSEELWYGLSNELVRFDTRLGTKQSFAGHEGTILSAVFSKDGSAVISFSEDGTARLWSMLEEPSLLRAFTSWPPIEQQTIASCQEAKEIQILDLSSKKEQRLTTKEVCKLARISPDRKVVAAVEEGMLELWELSSPSSPKSFSLDTKSPSQIIQFSPDSRWLLTSNGPDRLWLLDRLTGIEQTLPGHTGEITNVAFSPDGLWLASVSADETVRLWDLSTNPAKESQTLKAGGRVFSVSFSPSGGLLAFSGMMDTVGLFDLQTKKLSFIPCEGMSVNLVFSPDGQWLAVGKDNDVLLWDVQKNTRKEVLHRHQEFVYGLLFSPDSRLLSSGSLDGTVRLWDVATGESRIAASQELGFFGAQFLPDGETLIAFSMSGRVSQQKDDLPHQPKELLLVLKEKAKELRGE